MIRLFSRALMIGGAFFLGVLFLGSAAFGADDKPVKITADFPGGNIIVDQIQGDEVRLRQDLRDTEGFWFYWMFRIEGAKGRTLHFNFTGGGVVGARGPAVSSDGGTSWRWLSEKPGFSRDKFDYTFGPEENDVLFAMSIPYLEKNWNAFMAPYNGKKWPDGVSIRREVLCKTRKGRDVESVRIGNPDAPKPLGVILSCRNHACEMTADFLLEGILSELFSDSPDGKWLRENADFFVVPFVDKDGVEDGDQGKNRKPHDHNRDYTLEIYPEVKALKAAGGEFAKNRRVMQFDLHCPYIRDGMNEWVYFPGPRHPYFAAQQVRLSRFLEEETQKEPGGVPHRTSDNLPFGKDWNTGNAAPELMKCAEWGATIPSAFFAGSIEIPFANSRGAEMTPESVRRLGRQTARAMRRFLEEEQTQPTEKP